MRPFGSAGLGAIRRTCEDPIAYTSISLGLIAEPLTAVRSEGAAPEFQGSGETLREISFEISYSLLAGRPRKGDLIVHNGKTWKADDITDRDDIAAWLVKVTTP